jgi:diaminohydroxyphosphoribosylaminopyrimidine deaminase / 5-amino-6-(5-phosphoribosylamino)uracil reductase
MLTDAEYMARAFLHAERGRGRTTPNPVVGAVVVSADGVVVGHGYHERAGEPHAEVHALDAAGTRAHGATLYCTLEPCSHVGRTGPCAARIVDAGIRRVVASIEDPNPLVSGRGFAFLRDHGVHVDVGLGRRDALMQNAPFFSVMRRRRPLVIAKVALSSDNRIAGPAGVRAHLTSETADRRVQLWRASVDAIAVGIGTVLADDPLLTARGPYRERPLVRAIFDRQLRTPDTARILRTVAAGPVVILTTREAVRRSPDRVSALSAAGATIESLDATTLLPMIERLARYDVTSVLVEGGATIHREAAREGLIDRLAVLVTPHALGADGIRWLDGDELPWPALAAPHVTPLGPDVLLESHVHRID